MLTPFEASLQLKGRQNEIAFFRQLLEQKRMPHAWIISGAAGSGKMSFCLALARMMLGGGPDNPKIARHITHNTHSDLLIIAPPYDEKKKKYKDDIPVASIRRINNFLHKTTAEGGWRIVIIHGADRMNINASNALLKILEEPPSQTAFFLTSSATAKLLPTIRSRCRKFQLAPLSKDVLREIVGLLPEDERNVLEHPTSSSQLFEKSQGRPGKLFALIKRQDSGFEQLIEKSLSKPSRVQSLEIIDTILNTEDGFGQYFLSLLSVLEDRGRQKALREGETSYPVALSWAQLLQIYNATNFYNLDKRQALIEAMSIMSKI